jgi:hypothetical protein
MHATSSLHDLQTFPRMQIRALFLRFSRRVITFAHPTRPPWYTRRLWPQRTGRKKREATLESILSTVKRGFADLEGKMHRGFAAVAEDIADIKSTMVTKADFNKSVEKIENRLSAVESKIGGIHNRMDDEALKRANLENRVRAVVPKLPPPPERV